MSKIIFKVVMRNLVTEVEEEPAPELGIFSNEFVEFFVVAQFLIKSNFQRNCDNLYSLCGSQI